MTRLDFGREAPVFYLEHCPSTNTRMKELARQGAGEGTVLVASCQSEGRGRMGRSFASPEGGIYLSMLLRPKLCGEKVPQLSALAAVAVRRALLECCKVQADIKWPNDLLLQGKKVCGILAETVVSSELSVILGIGVNLNTRPEQLPQELSGLASSVAALSGKEYDRNAFIRCLLRELDGLYSQWQGGKSFRDEYAGACVNPGKELIILRGGKQIPAQALDITEDLSLAVRFADGRVENIRFGEVSVKGLY